MSLRENRLERHAQYEKILKAAKTPAAKTEAKRQLARGQLFYLLVKTLGRVDVDRDWLFARCEEVQNSPNGHLDLWAREHYKSTIITFGLTIQDILVDPEITVGIFSHTRPIAKGFLRQIKREFEWNTALKSLFPDILYQEPHERSPKWSEDDGLVVKRRGNPKESTVEAWGLVDGQPTGKHFSLMVYDDVVTRESVTTPDMIRKVTDAWGLSRNLTMEGGRTRYIGTRYHYNDTYGTMMDRKAARPRIHPATVNGAVDGEPVLFTAERLAEKRREMGPYIFGCQMLLDPKADETQGFKENWLAFWPARHTANMNLYIVVDPASSRRKSSDYTFMGVVGVAPDENFYIVTMIRDRLSLTQRADALFALHRDYKPLGVGYEEYGLQADIEHMKDRMGRENYRFGITALGGRLGKEDRIRRLVPLFEQGRILLPEHCMRRNHEGISEDLTRVFIGEEYLPFPVGAHDDMLDGLSRIVDPKFPVKAPREARRGAGNPARAMSRYDPLSW
ncbi:MAG: hypothetical protein ACE5FR_10785 [Rhodospirillales bacterium]